MEPNRPPHPGGVSHDDDRHQVVGYSHSSDHHISHAVALIAEVNDPATAHHIIEEEEKWVKSDGGASSTQSPSVKPPSEKIEYALETNENDEELRRTQSKTSLAAMMKDFPDGGRRAWCALVGATLIAFSTFGRDRVNWLANSGMTNSFGVYQTYYASHQLSNNTPSDIAWIGSFQLFCMFVGGTVSGRIFDTYGPKWLLRVGSVMYFLAFILLPECKAYWQYFLCQGVLFGIGIATVYAFFSEFVDNSFFPSLGCLNHYFLKRRAMAIGIMVGGSSAGGLV